VSYHFGLGLVFSIRVFQLLAQNLAHHENTWGRQLIPDLLFLVTNMNPNNLNNIEQLRFIIRHKPS
jgi:hypothetical protein